MIFGYGTRIGVTGPFSPANYQGLVGWFDMQDPSSYAQAGTVTAITNKASGVLWTEATAPPPYSATGLNGFPCMVGNQAGSTKIISSEAVITAAMADANPGTVFVVAQTPTPDDATAAWGVGNSGFSSARTKRYGLNTGGLGQWGLLAVDDAGGAATLTSTASVTDTLPHVLEFFHSGGTGTILVDGLSCGADNLAYAPGTLTPSRCALLCRPDSVPDQFWNGPVGEVIVFNRELSALERSQIRAYLRAKWRVINPKDPLSIVSSVPSIFYHTADLGVTTVTGVSTWTDQSGNSRTFQQATTGSQPVYNATGLNGKGIITFDGVDDFLAMSYIPPAPGTTPSWYWIVFNPIIGGNGNTIFASNNTNRHRFYWGNSSLMSMSCGLGTNSGVVTSNQWYRGEVLFINDTADYRKVGPNTVTGSNSGNNPGAVNFTLGANNSSLANPANVSVAAFGAWAGQPTNSEKSALDQWVFDYFGGLVAT